MNGRPDPLVQQLLDLLQLLQLHAEAVRAGDADALPPLAERIRRNAAALPVRPGRVAEPAVVGSLLRLCRESLAMLARRAQDTDRSLQALGLADLASGAELYGRSGAPAPRRRWRGVVTA